MGFDTSLSVDGKNLILWRKYASSLPRFLFSHDDLCVEMCKRKFSVVFTASAGKVLENLERAGLGWNATIAAYSSVRQGHAAEGVLWSRLYEPKVGKSEFEQKVQQFRNAPAEYDLVNLGQTLVNQWRDDRCDEVSIFKDISYDGKVNDSIMEIVNLGRLSGFEEVEAATVSRAAESIIILLRDAPLVAWPMLLCVFVKQLPKEVNLTFDITAAADNDGVADSFESARDYANSYWEGATAELSATAVTLSRLFGAIASFEGSLGSDFWFARAVDILYQIKNPDPGVTTKRKGDLLEELMSALVNIEASELAVIEKNFRTREEEIDLVLSNSLTNPFWISIGSPLILVECKNWASKIGNQELRVFESKMRDRGAICKVGIFVSIAGFSSTFFRRLKQFQESGGVIFALDGEMLESVLLSRTRLTEWLRTDGLVRALGR